MNLIARNLKDTAERNPQGLDTKILWANFTSIPEFGPKRCCSDSAGHFNDCCREIV
jgi:hypothetical protein